MLEEKPLYTSVRIGIAVPSFGAFCRSFRGCVVQELYVREDGTGIYLKAGNRSVDLVYRPNSFNRALLGKITVLDGQLNMFPEGKEPQTAEYIPIEEVENAKIAVERPDVIRGMLSVLYEGKDLEEAFIETRLGAVLNMKGFRTPHDTPFFSPSPVPVRFKDDEVVFFMEPDAFLYTICEDGETKTVYAPREADR